MIRILKRTGKFVDFNADKISNAIMKAMKETKEGVDEELAKEISLKIEEELLNKNFPIPVEMVQDLVENYLMDSVRKDVAKKYILYRYERDKSRDSRNHIKKIPLLKFQGIFILLKNLNISCNILRFYIIVSIINVILLNFALMFNITSLQFILAILLIILHIYLMVLTNEHKKVI